MLFGSASSSIYRLRPSITQDSYGDPVESWESAARFLLRNARAQDVTTKEVDGVVRRVVTDEKILFVPGRADLMAKDRVEILGQVWKVDGSPKVRTGLASSVYTTATLVRVSG